MGSGLAGLHLKSTQGRVVYCLGIGQFWEGQSLQGQPGPEVRASDTENKSTPLAPPQFHVWPLLGPACPRVQFTVVASLDPCWILIQGVARALVPRAAPGPAATTDTHHLLLPPVLDSPHLQPALPLLSLCLVEGPSSPPASATGPCAVRAPGFLVRPRTSAQPSGCPRLAPELSL